MIFTDILLLGIIIVVAIVILKEFIISRDGILRKIMICYFIIEILTYGFFIWYLLSGVAHGLLVTYLPVILLPKAVLKIYWYNYLISLKK